MKIKSFGLSDVGKRREKNEDSFLIREEMGLYVVADGMGGHLGGNIASKMAVDTIFEVMAELEDDPDMTLQDGGVVRAGEYQSHLRYAVRLASKRVYQRALENKALRGMGTTVVVLFFRNNKAYIAHVGDSRAYRIRGNEMIQITKDHSLVGEQIRAGLITEEEARTHRLKNVITRSVGFQEGVDADIDIRVVREGDRFLLCSDGLTNMIRNEDIRDIVVANDVENGCRRAVDIANERGGDDNITILLSEVVGLDTEEEETLDPTDEPTIEF